MLLYINKNKVDNIHNFDAIYGQKNDYNIDNFGTLYGQKQKMIISIFWGQYMDKNKDDNIH